MSRGPVALGFVAAFVLGSAAIALAAEPGPSTPVGIDPHGAAGLTVDVVPTPTPDPIATTPPIPTPLAHPAVDGEDGCAGCHAAIDDKQAEITAAWTESVHGAEKVGCADCHGGDPRSDSITVAMNERAGYIGIPSRKDTVGICGGCHSDANRMRPYGVATDQYSKYYTSVHGQRLLTAGDARVAICIDCHGVHDTKKASDPTADVYPLNVPDLCAKCHADADVMEPYGIPTDQFDVYKESVHGKLLLDEQDVRAPSCVSCHGSHAAKPPQASEVVDVCGKCHTATQELFSQSRHAEVPAVGPKCWTCHGTHDVTQPDESILLHEGELPDYLCATCHEPSTQALRLNVDQFENPADRRCDTCHHPASLIYTQVEAISEALIGAAEAYDRSELRIREAAALGMIVADAEVAAAEARTELIKARASVHTTKLTSISELSDAAVEKSAAATQLAQAKLDESLFRRQAMIVVIAIIILNVFVLMALRRALHASSGGTDPKG